MKVHGSGRLTVRNRRFCRRVVPFGDKDVSGEGRQTVRDSGEDEAPLDGIVGDNPTAVREKRVSGRDRKQTERFLVTGRENHMQERPVFILSVQHSSHIGELCHQ